MTKPNKNDMITSASITAGVIGVATMLSAAPVGIAAGCMYLGIKLLESREDPNTIRTEYIEAPHRKKSEPTVIPHNIKF